MNAPQKQFPRLEAAVAAIRSMYGVRPQGFSVGPCQNDTGKNLMSLAILGFAARRNLSKEETLLMFGEAYDEVLADSQGTSHPNIRALMKHGMGSVAFEEGGIELHPQLKVIDGAWEERANFSPIDTPQDVREAVVWVVDQLDAGTMRASHRMMGHWNTNQWVKKAVLLSFRLTDNEPMSSGFDKVDSKFAGFTCEDFKKGGYRVVPPAAARYGSYIGKNVVLMPSFVNIGAYVDEGTMVDTWATVGSCAQIGKNCHLSGGVGIGGVLEPLQASPTIIEDNCFIGARSEVVEGVVVGEGSVLAMGCFISQSTKILDRETGAITYGKIPPYSVVVPGTLPGHGPREHSLNCVVIVKTVDAQTRAKTATNELLRE